MRLTPRYFICPRCSRKVDTEIDGGNDWGWATSADGSSIPVCADCEIDIFDGDDAGYPETPDSEGSQCG